MGSSSSREAKEAQKAANEAMMLLDQQKLGLIDDKFWALARSCIYSQETCSLFASRFEKLLEILKELKLRPDEYKRMRPGLENIITDVLAADAAVDEELDRRMLALGLSPVELPLAKPDLNNPADPQVLVWRSRK